MPSSTPRVVRNRFTPRRLLATTMALALAAALGCASRSVSRKAVDEPIDLSGFWNDYDSQQVSSEMIRDCTSHSWAADYASDHRRIPVVIVGSIRNLTHEHLNTQTFVKDLERELVNSGNVGLVASSGQRGELREEREDQANNATLESMKSMGKELGADFMLVGQIDQINDSVEGKQVRYYQVELELIDLESNRKTWIGQKKIKKLVEQKGYKF